MKHPPRHTYRSVTKGQAKKRLAQSEMERFGRDIKPPKRGGNGRSLERYLWAAWMVDGRCDAYDRVQAPGPGG